MNTTSGNNRTNLSVIIVTWNVRECLKDCIDSIYRAATGIAIEIIIVDNNSDDGTPGYVQSMYPGIQVIKNNSNKGFGKACNQGFRAAKGEYILFLNPDTILLDDCLNQTLAFLKSQQDCAFIGCRMLNPDKSLQPSIRKFLTNTNLVMEHVTRFFKPASAMRQKYDYLVFPHEKTQVVDWLIGAFLMCPRSIFEALQGFDEEFFMYHEDTDICYRAAQQGKKVYFFADASMIHFGNQSGKKRFGDQTILEYYKAKHTFLKKHYPRRVLWLHRVLMTGLLSIRLLASFVIDRDAETYDQQFLIKGLRIQSGLKIA